MFSKFKVLSVALIALMAFGFWSYTTKADVTGYFETHISFEPQTTSSEISKLDFDFQNDLTVTVAISGLYTTLHSHFGIAGVEDIIVTFAATLGALEVTDEFVFARFAYGSITPFYDELHFLKKRVNTSICLGGVCFENLAMIEDTNAFVSQTSAYAFGDIMSVSGSTPSGITITGKTGLCATEGYNLWKKHVRVGVVNPECAGAVKPDIMFDFESLTISGVPLAAGVTADWDITCETVMACTLVNTIAFSGGPIPFTTSFTFSDLLSLDFDGATVTLSQGAGTLTVGITPAGEIGVVSISLSLTLNPDTNPASLDVDATIEPGLGLTEATVGLSISRAGLDLGVLAYFDGGGPPATFQFVEFTLGTSAGPINISTDWIFTTTGFTGGDVYLTVSF